MMWRMIPLVAVAACTPTLRPDAPPTASCVVREQVRMRYVGQRYVSSMREDLAAKTRSPVVRVLRPDDAATRDLREDRLNVLVGGDERIEGLRCG